MVSSERVWVVTGAGRGIGRALTEAALDAGERVIATVRDPRALDDLAVEKGSRLHVEVLDVRDRGCVHRAVEAGVAALGRLDVVVNNAGYGLVGAIEEIAEHDARAIVDTNLFGAVWLTQAALPHLRRQGSGDIVQISTVGAVGSMPTFGMYNASKSALEAFSEALAGEVARFGVRVTIAELSGFASDWAGSSMRFAAPQHAYDPLRTELFGTEVVPWPVGDAADEPPAALAATAIREHLESPSRPLRLLVGREAPALVGAALTARRDDYEHDPRFTWPAPSLGSETHAAPSPASRPHRPTADGTDRVTAFDADSHSQRIGPHT